MEKTIRSQKATSCTFFSENGTRYTLFLADNEVEICSQPGQDDPSQENIAEMTVTDLKQLIEAAAHLLAATGKSYLPPLNYPIASDII